jgi:hypothetical protein
MHLPLLARIALACALGAAGCAASTAEVGRQALLPGDTAVQRLTDLDGAAVDVAGTLAAHEATLLVWWATECPCVRRYEPRIRALRARYDAERVAVFAVASNADDSAARVRAVAAERGFDLPVWMDPGGALASSLGVRTTPGAVVLDRAGRVRFAGWIDNEREPGEDGRVAYAEQALDAVLGIGPSDVAERSPVYGCRITRTLGEPSPCSKRCSEGR